MYFECSSKQTTQTGSKTTEVESALKIRSKAAESLRKRKKKKRIQVKVAASLERGDLIEGVCFTTVHTEENERRYGRVRNEPLTDPEGDACHSSAYCGWGGGVESGRDSRWYRRPLLVTDVTFESHTGCVPSALTSEETTQLPSN